MKLLDLFSGIGGFSLAAHWLGWSTVAFVEKDEFCQKVLRKNFGNDIEIYDDITTFSGESFRGRIDIITGGFPCQPFSIAGQQKGSADERHLFPEMLRVIREVKPTYVVAENVRGLLGIESGETFNEICSSLENLGYAVQTFCIPACAVNAPHRRDRLWIIAHADDKRHIGRRKQSKSRERQISEGRRNNRPFGKSSIGNSSDARTFANPNGGGCGDEQKENGQVIQNEIGKLQTSQLVGNVEQCRIVESDSITADADNTGNRTSKSGAIKNGQKVGIERKQSFVESGRHASTNSDSESERLERRSGNGFGTPETRFGQSYFNEGWRENWLEVAAEFCRVDAGVSNRVDRLRSLGNAIVPQIAFEIFKAIEHVEKQSVGAD